ncbi:MAG: L,D-transpeptidase family protein [Clostridia bacterium]|nr:L,D-transpeptidase family protein [Clostridia bacterium]
MKKWIFLCLIGLLLFGFAAAEEVDTPSRKTTEGEKDVSYWTLPMDIRDEEAVWKMLTAPITVLKGNQKKQVYLRETPSSNGTIVGEVTCESQGVHVLGESENGWTKIECFSSSFHDSKSLQWNRLVQGYVKSTLLTTVKPNQNMGLVVDKLTQRMYIFRQGKLFTTLRVSTGLVNDKQPWNETRSGEYLLVSKVGGFSDGSMVCEKAIRYNSGDLIHQVPYNKRGNSKDFDPFEIRLGARASHGCIRVQRKRTPEGVNMSWIYDHYKKNTKIVIWEDWPDRKLPPVAADTVVYYNPNGGKNYHRSETCYGVTEKYWPLSPIFFGNLNDAEYSGLTPCVWCNPPEK